MRALLVLCRSKKGIIIANQAIKVVGLKGKAIGGVFSALSRQRVDGEALVEVWGRAEVGRGLRWKLNTKVVDQKWLGGVIKEVLTL